MWQGINCRLTRGGDLEVTKEFVAAYSLPAGQTIGLAKTAAGLRVFGHLPAPAGLDPAITYVRLVHPTNPALALVSINSWDLFSGKIYAIAQFENGDIRHYYDGTNVVYWNSGVGTQPVGWGSICRTHKRKMYSPIVSILWGSELDTIAFDTVLSGSFFQDMANHQAGSDLVTGLGVFNNSLAVISRRVIQIWSMQDDSANNAPIQFLTETGTRAPRSVIGFGDLDCFYLSDSGIRSLRARLGTNLAGVNDVGTPIDTVIRNYISTISDAAVLAAQAIIEPIDGRLWMKIGALIFVFTYFPSKKVSAWTWYDPGITFSDLVTLNDRIYGRSGDIIYLYGGANDDQWTTRDVTVALPFLTAGKPGNFKQLKAVDIAATGTWNMKVLVDPNDETQYVDVGDLSGVTFSSPDGIDLPANCTHLAPLMTHTGGGYASLSQIAMYDNQGATE